MKSFTSIIIIIALFLIGQAKEGYGFAPVAHKTISDNVRRNLDQMKDLPEDVKEAIRNNPNEFLVGGISPDFLPFRSSHEPDLENPGGEDCGARVIAEQMVQRSQNNLNKAQTQLEIARERLKMAREAGGAELANAQRALRQAQERVKQAQKDVSFAHGYITHYGGDKYAHVFANEQVPEYDVNKPIYDPQNLPHLYLEGKTDIEVWNNLSPEQQDRIRAADDNLGRFTRKHLLLQTYLDNPEVKALNLRDDEGNPLTPEALSEFIDSQIFKIDELAWNGETLLELLDQYIQFRNFTSQPIRTLMGTSTGKSLDERLNELFSLLNGGRPVDVRPNVDCAMALTQRAAQDAQQWVQNPSLIPCDFNLDAPENLFPGEEEGEQGHGAGGALPEPCLPAEKPELEEVPLASPTPEETPELEPGKAKGTDKTDFPELSPLGADPESQLRGGTLQGTGLTPPGKVPPVPVGASPGLPRTRLNRPGRLMKDTGELIPGMKQEADTSVQSQKNSAQTGIQSQKDSFNAAEPNLDAWGDRASEIGDLLE